MATHADIASRQAARKLRQAGLNEDGTPIDGANLDEQHEDDDDDQRQDDDQHQDDDDQHQDDDDQGDDLRRQVRELTEQLGAMRGRVAPTQQDLEDLRRVANTQRQQLDESKQTYEQQIAELRAQLEARELDEIDPTEFLSEDERADIDPAVLKALGKMAGGLAKRMAPKVDVRGEALRVLQEQEQNRIQKHRNAVLSDSKYGLQKLGALAQDPKFLAWAQKDDNDVDSAVNSLLRATSTEEIDRYARILQRKLSRYQEEQKAPASRQNNPAGARTTLAAGMRRNPGKQMSDQQVQEQLRKARALSRSAKASDRAEAQKILDSLQ